MQIFRKTSDDLPDAEIPRDAECGPCKMSRVPLCVFAIEISLEMLAFSINLSLPARFGHHIVREPN